ncbi:hypothetical protein J6590_053192 [Homalodisca vitripennis]|nr:hypothetical protein J6590_053192 [Homalodisca vitripennis]
MHNIDRGVSWFFSPLPLTTTRPSHALPLLLFIVIVIDSCLVLVCMSLSGLSIPATRKYCVLQIYTVAGLRLLANTASYRSTPLLGCLYRLLANTASYRSTPLLGSGYSQILRRSNTSTDHRCWAPATRKYCVLQIYTVVGLSIPATRKYCVLQIYAVAGLRLLANTASYRFTPLLACTRASVSQSVRGSVVGG